MQKIVFVKGAQPDFYGKPIGWRPMAQAQQTTLCKVTASAHVNTNIDLESSLV
ncbi:MAG TPA: hypothetical protein IAC65_05895 [Candidatus Aphodousia faecipullorum]|nr:hypothetical protein [Candidatus Aphodousia faecipullorum]